MSTVRIRPSYHSTDSSPSTSPSRLSDYSVASSSGDSAPGYTTDWSSYSDVSRQSSTTSLSSVSSYASRRPLPRVPSNASLNSVRPLPAVPQGMQIDLSQGKGTSIRPLPSPSPHPEYNAFRPLPIRTDSLYPHSSCRSPTLNLILDFKSTHAPMEFVLESPVGPISPITFDSDESQKHRRNQEDRLAIRLSAFGFVEVPESSPDGCSDEDAVFLVEEEPLSKGKRNSKRYSRKWVREKKGKRFVEEDYTRVIESLRRL